MVAKVNAKTGQWTMLADMSAAVMAHPAANVDPPDFRAGWGLLQPDRRAGKLYAVEANHGQLWSVTKKGDVEMVTDISKSEGHIVPTAPVDSDGGLLVATSGSFPITPDSSQLLTLRPGCGAGWGSGSSDCGPGTLHVASSSSPGLTTVVSYGLGAGWTAVSAGAVEAAASDRDPPLLSQRPATARSCACGTASRKT